MYTYRSEQLTEPRRVIGLAAGSTLGGIDAAAVEIRGCGNEIEASTVSFVMLSWDAGMKAHLQDAFSGKPLHPSVLAPLNTAVGLALADAAVTVRSAAGWQRAEVDAVGCAGPCLWRQTRPTEISGAFVTGSLELGDSATIAEETGAPVVSHFAARDMAAGGQGAPLSALTDWLLLRHPTRKRVVLNIGGVAGVTWLPSGCGLDDVTAFHAGPGTLVLDAAGLKNTGESAVSAHAKEPLLEMLLKHDYPSRRPPKTTGRDEFGPRYVEELRSAMREPLGEWLPTLTAFVAECAARAIREYLPSRPDEVILTGGGSVNAELVMMLRKRIPCPVLIGDEVGVNGAARDAVTAAVLADRTLQGLPGNVPHDTGAGKPVVLGSVTF